MCACVRVHALPCVLQVVASVDVHPLDHGSMGNLQGSQTTSYITEWNRVQHSSYSLNLLSHTYIYMFSFLLYTPIYVSGFVASAIRSHSTFFFLEKEVKARNVNVIECPWPTMGTGIKIQGKSVLAMSQLKT